MNKFFANVTKDLKKVKTLGGRDNFSVTRGSGINFDSMPVADNSLRDAMAQDGARREQEDAAKQAQYAQIAESLGKMVPSKDKPTSIDPNDDMPMGHDLPQNGGITGRMPYDPKDNAIPESVKVTDKMQRSSADVPQGTAMENPVAAAVVEKYGDQPTIQTLGGTQNVDGQDRYARDSYGIPQRPTDAKGTDYVLRSDGTPSKWTWDSMDAMRKEASTMSPEAAKAQREGRLVEYNGKPVVPQRTEGNRPDQQEIRELPPGVEVSDAERMYQNEVKPLLTRDYKKGGKDYDKKHDWKDILRSAGLGVLQAVGNADPRGGMAGILGAAIGGGGGGAIAGAFDRNFDNKIQDQAKLARVLPQYQAMAQRERDIAEENRKAQKAQIETRKANIDADIALSKEERDRFLSDPDFLIIKESKTITPEQADRLNKKFGTSYSPAYWGTYIDKEVGGQHYTRATNDPNFKPNASVPVDKTKTPVQDAQGNWTTSEDAARIKAQADALKATLGQRAKEHEDRMGLSRQQFAQAMEEFRYAATQKTAADAAKNAESAREWAEKIAKMIRNTEAAYSDGKLTEEQYTRIMSTIGNFK